MLFKEKSIGYKGQWLCSLVLMQKLIASLPLMSATSGGLLFYRKQIYVDKGRMVEGRGSGGIGGAW